MTMRHLLLSLAIFSFSYTAHAAFPDDLSDVVILEASPTSIKSFAQTGTMTVFVSPNAEDQYGEGVYMDSNKKSVWRAGGGNLSCCNANAWLFVKVGDTWYGATWEFLRVGTIRKSAGAMVGPRHLIYPPLNNFRVRDGEIYGFMLAGITRNGEARINVRERTNIVFWKWGEGPVSAEEAVGGEPVPDPADPEAPPSSVAPAVNLLMEDELPAPPAPPMSPL